MNDGFSQAVIDNLKFYVYFLRDPMDNKIFYVGKGQGNRIFQHLACALETSDESDKLETIRKIVKLGKKVEHFILRHGLTEECAFAVEAALIDFLGKNSLANIQSGHHTKEFGIKTTDEISALYDAKELSADHPIILININKHYKQGMKDEELYEATRKAWVIGKKRNEAKFAIAVCRGLTRETYEIEGWEENKKNKRRWEFIGVLAPDSIREKYNYKSVKKYFEKGAANPIKYINILKKQVNV
ncbi:MAG: hypothetical protein M1591_01045 [Deltaproteobacteria bacterium]|nr:hypothetical protein [Deltaproteobacteria bacterium]